MAILLNELLKEISSAISSANYIMEETALDQYMAQGYQKEKTDNGLEDCYSPLTFNIALQDGTETRRIPIAALVHNTTMRLEQVDMKLKFNMYEQDGGIMVSCMPAGAQDTTLDEMTLQFKNTASPEGIAKITDNHIKKI